MSMRGAARSGAEATIRALARRALTLRRAGRLDQALARVREASGQLPAGTDAAPAPWSPLAAELLALECGVLIDGGRLDGVLPRLDAALQRELAADPPDAARVARTRLHLEAGRLHALQLRLAPARAHLLEVLAAALPDTLATLEGEPGGCVGVRAQAMLGAALCMHAEHAEGLQRLEQALADSQAQNLDTTRLDRARILINISAAHFEQRRLDEAQRRIEQAQALLQPLVRERRAGARADLGRAWINLGGIHADAGRLTEAIGAYRTALDTIDRAARSAALAGDRSRLRATRAKASMNLGHALFRSGDFEGAERHLDNALRRYAPLMQSNPQLRADVARARVNTARLAARRGQADRAAALYARALTDFESLMQGGTAPHLAGDAANARLGVARAALARGQARRSARQFAAAMAALRELTHAGQLHHAPAWLLAWLEQASVLVESAPSEATLGVMLPVLLGVLEAPPLRALGELEEPLRMPATALEAVQRWRAAATAGSAPREAVAVVAAACLRHLFDATAQVLAESSPAWLAARQDGMRDWVRRLGEAAAAHTDAAPLLAQWLLCTRGLRAQRVALATGSDARLAALRKSLAQLNQIEGELLGALREREAADALLVVGADAPAPNAARLAEWRVLRDTVARTTASAVQDGLLPRALRLSTPALVQRLAPRQALLFVARLDRTRLVAVALRPTGAQHTIAALPAALADAPCDLLVAAAGQALRHDFGGKAWREVATFAPRRIALTGLADAAAGDRLALTALRELAELAPGPTLRSLLDSGCADIGIVPADDLHLLPWGDLVRAWSAGDVTIGVYPNAAAWWRCRVLDPSPADDRAAPRWALACAADTGDAPRLRWVEIERRQSQRLWAASPGDVADALLAMGHSEVPDGNPARAGLRLSDGRVLGAHEAGTADFERVLLSACVLGRTDDAFGEALGFLASCFAYRARFGAGWLTEVPDEAAGLFSLALQFALREALAGGRAMPGWSAVFHATCRALERGAWPAGFADWLGREVPCPAVPPASLRRVLPWVVALGD